MAINVTPMGKRVLIALDEVSETTTGGLIVPPDAQGNEKPEVGEVVKLGTGADGFTFTVEVGQKVFFMKYSPDEVEVEGVKYLVMEEEDILAVLG